MRARKNGTIGLLALLFIASAGVRLGTSAVGAVAETGLLDAAELSEDQARPASNVQFSDEYLHALIAREAKVKKLERHNLEAASELEKVQREINQRLRQLQSAEEALRSTIALANSAAENDLDALTQMYQNMKPKDAALLFDEMDPEFASGFLARMRPDAAAQILSGLSPQNAYSISVILAGRNAEVPTQ